MKKFAIIALSLLVILTLAACGEDGSSGTTKTVVSGIASKGPIINGTVIIYAVTDGAKGDLLAAVTTDAGGNYSADLGSYTGPVMVEASGSYLDEATGEFKTVPADSPLRAALPAAQGMVSLPVTPITELAYIKTGGTLTPDSISAANSLVSSLFKVNIVATLPVAPTAGALAGATQAQQDYTLALATISQVVKDAGGNLTDTLNTLAQSITTTGMSSDAAATVQAALTTFVTTNTNNQTGVTNTSSTGLTNIGTLSKSYKLSLQGGFSPGSVTGLQFNLSLPAGVTLDVNNSTSAVLASSLVLSGNAPTDALLATRYANGTVTIGILTTSGFSVGEIATLTCNIPAGVSTPSASSFSATNLRSIDKNGVTVAGASISIQ